MAYTITIAGTNRTGLHVRGSLNITNSVRGAATAEFSLVDTTQLVLFSTGEEVAIVESGTKIFGGTIEGVSLSVPKGTAFDGATFMDIDCVGWSKLADRFTVKDTFTDKSQGDIFKEIVTETDLTTEGVTTANVDDGLLVDEARFDYEFATKVFDKIAELSDMTWWIDENKALFLKDRGYTQTPVNYGTGDRNYLDARLSRSRSKYSNRVFLRAGKDKTTESVVDSFVGDGEARSWTLSLPVAAAPLITLDSVSKVVGIRNVDKEEDDDGNPTAFDFFYEIDSSTISSNHAKAAAPDGDVIEVTYTGLFDMVIQADNPVEIAARKVIESGSGIYEDVFDDDSIDGRDNAVTRAYGLLDSQDDIGDTFSIKTLTGGIKIGMFMTLTFPELGVSGDWVVEKVRISDLGDKAETFQWNISLKKIGLVVSAHSFWRSLEEQGRRFIVRENETLQVLQKDFGQMTITDGQSVIEDDPYTFGWEADEHTHFLIGLSEIGNCQIKEVEDTSV